MSFRERVGEGMVLFLWVVLRGEGDEALQPCRGSRARSRRIGVEKEMMRHQVNCIVHEADVMQTCSL